MRRVIGPLRRRAPDYVETGDLAQEARIACWKALDSYNGKARLSTFLYLVGLRAGLRWIRTEVHLRGITETQYRCGGGASREISWDALGKSVGRDGLAGRVAARDCVRAFLASLPDGERIACEQRMDGLTSTESAHVAGGKPSSVRRRLMRVRRKAKEWFEL